ncbi:MULTISPECIES: S41 family peptidase [Bacillus]|uniref:C-terminal processing peptidase n=1 Tax=Bacillus glycinifermentans TaxID=1664069 RepID=A0AAJ3Z1D3_9BACI|nr:MULTISPECIES: S41 family peptidase [Bacillus]KKB74992.1 peptidase S41 [Bacillus sp. TH008]MBU8784958.1 peptidoglycan-binding protein [Bacillus glycinifermentans]MDU0071065.1 S41 family peptidase [Bacillus sp. IG6]MED8018933.1 S41 family peptidase [Bacillus glycinifermentans]NUJ15133.1 PDZ domain-containing protein [Bacillus glycinifermentans]
MKQQLKLFLIVLVTAVAASALTLFIVGKGNGGSAYSSADSEKFEKLMAAYDKIKSDYYKKADDEKLTDGAIKGMLEALGDPYSTYMDKKEAQSFEESITSSFEGIGAQVEEKNGQILIVAPIKGSPAEKAGLKPHDEIQKVDGKSVKGKTVNEAVAMIRGKKGTDVKLVLKREGVGEIDVTIKRDTIPVETVYSKMIDGNIGEIQITSFSENTAKELTKAIDDLTEKGAKRFVLDLRGNPGGLMDQAITMSNLFVDKGKTIMQVEPKNGTKEVYKAENERKVTKPTVVLVNGGTASAAEIMAAALHQASGIPIVGEKTFGKGTVQNAENFSDGSTVKLTIAKWLTPNGNWIHEKGIEPQYKAELPSYAKLPYLDPKKKYQSGSTGDEVKVAQKMLKALGYNVKPTGSFDDQTVQAVKAFQSDQKLKTTGIITGETTSGMTVKLQDKLSKHDTQLEKAIEIVKKEK